MQPRIKKTALIVALIVIISILHYFGGDFHSPIHHFYKLLYLLPIVLAGFFFGFRGGVITSIVAGIVHSPFVLLSLSMFGPEHYYDFLDIVIFIMIGIVSGTFSQQLTHRLTEQDFELKRRKLLENYSNSVIESIKCGVVAVNNDSLITMINKSAAGMFNSDKASCIGRAFGNVLPECRSFVELSLREYTMQENIELNVDLAGKKHILRLRLFPLQFENSDKGLVAIIEDVTELRSLQNQIIRNEKFAALGELSAGIAHEIRNPLAIIKAIGQTMRKDMPDRPDTVRELEIIDEEIGRANKVVTELMEFGKPPKNEFQLCSINELVKEVLTISANYLHLHKIHTEFNDDETALVWADKAQLKQVLINILFNSTQAMAEGGTISISAANQNSHYVKMVISDTGIGIPQTNIERVFNPFFTTKEHGTGLGLSIVQRIIEEHGGVISIASKEGHGTTVEILIPRLKESDSE